MAGFPGLAMAMVLAGCTPDQPPVKKGEPVKAPVAAPSEKSGVARIVFLDLEDCCECTRNRIDTSWNALQATLSGDGAAPPVDRIHMDTQSGKAAPYQELKPVMVAPALYFLGKDGKLLTFLQGEVKEEQISNLIGSGT